MVIEFKMMVPIYAIEISIIIKELVKFPSWEGYICKQ